MGVKAGQITINLDAGTARFISEIDQAKGKLREFGATGVSSSRETTAALRVMESGFASNNRAAAAFINTVLGGGAAMKAIFPIFGAVAFAGVLGDITKNAYNFVKSIQEAPAKMANAFRDLNEPLKVTNTQLALSNARLENDIAKLEGKRPNMLKEALLEARLESEKLAESLEKNLRALSKLMDEQKVGALRQLFGEAGTGDLSQMINKLRSGVASIEGGNTSDKDKADRVARLYQAALQDVNNRLSQAPGFNMLGSALSGAPQLQNTSARDNALVGLREFITDQLQQIDLQGKNSALAGKRGQAEAANPARLEMIRLQNQLNEAQAAQLDGLDKIDKEERNELATLKERNVLNAQTAAKVHEIYDVKRVTELQSLMESLGEVTHEYMDTLTKIDIEGHKAMGESFTKEIEAGNKELEERSKRVTKLMETLGRLNNEMATERGSHALRMIGINDSSAGPVAVLAAQQAIERQAIEDRYQNSLKLANSDLEKANALKQKQLDLLKLQDAMEERVAEQRQKGIRDFFLEMQFQSEKAGQILYDSMHHALDDVSAQLAKLFTGQKTQFGKMFQNLGQSMLQSTIKSALSHGLGAIGSHIPGAAGDFLNGVGAGMIKMDGSSPAKALFVKVVGGGSGGGSGSGSGDSDDSSKAVSARDLGGIAGGAITGGRAGLANGVDALGNKLIGRGIDKFASSGEFVGDLTGLAEWVSEESEEFTAGGIKRTAVVALN